MLAEARPEPCEDECDCCSPDDPDTAEAKKFYDVATKHVHAATDELPDPAVHGIMAEEILNNMLRWHLALAKHHYEEGEIEAANAWMRDAGKFQAILNILETVGFGSNDPRCQD